MSRRLASVPERPLRVLGVVRVSKERDGMVSPEMQVAAITDYCAARGYVLADVVEGIDQSGSQKRSAWWPTLDRSVAAVEAGEYDGLVVWKFSRTARQRLKWATALDRVETAGGVLESATEQFDTTTSAGRFARGMVAEMNAFEAERIGEGWVEAHERRVRSGRPHTGKPKWGYLYDPERQLHLPHPEQGPVLAEVYRRYVAGESLYALVRWLNAHGWRTLEGGAWSDRSLRRVMDAGFASGVFIYRGQEHQGIHEPLIDADLWQAYQDARAARRALPARTERSVYLLSGLVRCARCGRPMVANKANSGTRLSRRTKGAAAGLRYSNGRPRMTFRCDNGKKLGVCPGGSINMSLVEAHVLDYLRDLAGRIDDRAAGAVVASARRSLLEVEQRRVAGELVKVEQALVRLAVRDAESPMPAGVYAAALGELEQRRTELAAVAEATGREVRRSSSAPARDAAQLLEEWEELPIVGRREVLRGLMDCVLVRTGPEGARWMRVVERDELQA